MEGNIDQHIREKLQDREIHPSASAWERLSVQLDENQSKKKRDWFLYVGYAASILLLVSLFMLINNSDKDDSIVPEMILVEDDITKPEIDKSKEFISIPKEEVIVQNDKQDINPVKVESTEKNQDQKKIEKRIKKQTPFVTNTKENSVIASQEKKKESKVNIKEADFNKRLKEITRKEETVVAKTTDTKSEIETKLSNGRISVDSDALLMSVTGSKEEVRAYYKKYKIDRAEVLLAIQKELKKSKVKVNPETILAEVELEVNEENFQNNFYQFIKKRVSTVATAIANRNN
jgi:hypothetical protein